MIPTVEAVIDEQGYGDRLRLERITTQPMAALRLCTRGLLLVLAATSMLLGLPAPGAAQPLVYVSNSGAASLSVVDARAGRVTGGVSFSVGIDPMGVAVSPDGRFAYVTNTASSSVSVIETRTNAVTATIPVGDVPSTVAFTPDGRFAYVTSTCGHDRTSICATGDVAVIDTGSQGVLAVITVGERPEGIAITPDGTRAYVANTLSNTISVIDTATNLVTGEIAFPPSSTPASVAITPDGAALYVVNVDAGAVAVVDTATSIVTATLLVGNLPLRTVLTPDGRFAYVTNAVGSTVTVIDTASNTIVANIPARSPEAVAVTPEGAFAYVTDPDAGGVLRIDTRTNMVDATIALPTLVPLGIAITPDGRTGYVVDYRPASVSVIDLVASTIAATVPGDLNPAGIAANATADVTYVAVPNADAVFVVETASGRIARRIDVPPGSGPVDVALSPDGAIAYVVNERTASVSTIDTETGRTVAAIPVVYAFPQRIAVSPDGASAYVTYQYAGAVSIIDTNTKAIRATVSLPVEGMSTGIAVTPDGSAVYVTSVPPIPLPDHQPPRPTPEPGAVSVIDAHTNAVVGTVVMEAPSDVAISPDGRTAYVSNGRSLGDVVVIDTARVAVVGRIQVGLAPSAIAISRDGATAYVANENSDSLSVIDTGAQAVIGTVPVGRAPAAIEIVQVGGSASPTPTLGGTLLPTSSKRGNGCQIDHPASQDHTSMLAALAIGLVLLLRRRSISWTS